MLPVLPTAEEDASFMSSFFFLCNGRSSDSSIDVQRLICQ